LACPYLEGKNLRTCAAFEGTMVLSVGELNNYCTTEQSFAKCEFFIKAESEDRKDKETKEKC